VQDPETGAIKYQSWKRDKVKKMPAELEFEHLLKPEGQASCQQGEESGNLLLEIISIN
jgi:hypothetical protein